MEVGEVHILGVDAEGVAAVVLSLEVDGHGTHGLAAHHGVVFAFQRDVDLGAAVSELELGQLAAFVEADDGAV